MSLPPITVLDAVGSTNDVARTLGLAGAPHGSAVAARKQTAGRGRRGHVWESPLGNVYLSVVLRPRVAPARLPGLAAACGVGALDGLRALAPSREPLLKWPNDILARKRKLAGILVEAVRGTAGDALAVCGIGVNVSAAPRDLAAVSLAELAPAASADAASDVGGLAAALRDHIVARVDAWSAADGDRPLDGVREDYLARLAWLSAAVVARDPESGAELARGTLVDVDPWGRAVLETSSGRMPLTAEQASLRPASDA